MGRLFKSLMVVLPVLVVTASCAGGMAVNMTGGTTGSGGGGAGTGSGGAGTSVTSTVATTSTTATTTTTGTGGGGGSTPDAGAMCTVTDQPYGAMAIAAASCAGPPPPGATLPSPLKPYTGGTCPMLTAYDGTDATLSTLTSMGNMRQLGVVVPKDLQPSEVLPVIFLWYWLKGSANDFYTQGDVQNAVDNQRFIAVIPVAKGDISLWNWPFSIIDSSPRQEEEYTFFDDMLTCVAAQFNVNTSCVSTAGVSAGALFTDQLVGARSDYLASFISLSGGVGGVVKPYASPPPPHAVPGIVLWGGAMDSCIVINFQTASQTLEQSLVADCNFMVECVHNCGHGVPPFDPDAGSSAFAGLWQFSLDHPYWLPAGTSPYTTRGLPSDLPAWCAVGAGNATPRTGMCSAPGCM